MNHLELHLITDPAAELEIFLYSGLPLPGPDEKCSYCRELLGDRPNGSFAKYAILLRDDDTASFLCVDNCLRAVYN